MAHQHKEEHPVQRNDTLVHGDINNTPTKGTLDTDISF